ncbi:hypothetical protein WJ33_23475 [Burkholderia ubonensis]|uniref:Uncharacterized protein n=1 Tax=Burkholderia ubonensis TaxID=101571 RepID=A0A103RJ86_9BURK|nr:hypothetical protein WJ33_23475 [Burkholderia ubonensis]
MSLQDACYMRRTPETTTALTRETQCGHEGTFVGTDLRTLKRQVRAASGHLRFVLTRFAVHPINRIDEFAPWRAGDRLDQLCANA